MMPIFADDAPLDARREAAYQRLLSICPAPLRMLAQPMVRVAIERSSEAEIAALMVDIDTIPEMAQSGDYTGIVGLARRYGATDEMVGMYLPLFEAAAGKSE
jgi:hypothetical protein